MSGCNERFLCDEMLVRLGRWLRAAGYDVVIANSGEDDARLLQQACDEDRLLVTRDRKMLELRQATGRVVLLEQNQLAGQFEELSWLCAINWLCQPFSRCLECNSELVLADESIRRRVPEEARRDGEDILYCQHCDQPYWYGSHVKRMRRKLQHLSRGEWDAGADDEVRYNHSENHR